MADVDGDDSELRNLRLAAELLYKQRLLLKQLKAASKELKSLQRQLAMCGNADQDAPIYCSIVEHTFTSLSHDEAVAHVKREIAAATESISKLELELAPCTSALRALPTGTTALFAGLQSLND